jgi:uncharacterized protein (DUF1778 family)
MPTLQEVKTERIDIRTTQYAKRLLQEAARVAHKNVSDFLLENGIAAAEQSLADRRLFALNDTAWNAFQAVLDQPVAKSKPQLRKLLTHKGVFG